MIYYNMLKAPTFAPPACRTLWPRPETWAGKGRPLGHCLLGNFRQKRVLHRHRAAFSGSLAESRWPWSVVWFFGRSVGRLPLAARSSVRPSASKPLAPLSARPRCGAAGSRGPSGNGPRGPPAGDNFRLVFVRCVCSSCIAFVCLCDVFVCVCCLWLCDCVDSMRETTMSSSAGDNYVIISTRISIYVATVATLVTASQILLPPLP